MNVDMLENSGVSNDYCEVCGSPGYIKHYPSSVPYTGVWCDPCFDKLKRKERVKIYCIVAAVGLMVTLVVFRKLF